jgi:hypothetical protein
MLIFLRHSYRSMPLFQFSEAAPPPAALAARLPAVPPHRLVNLLQTAMAAQIQHNSRGQSSAGASVDTCALYLIGIGLNRTK